MSNRTIILGLIALFIGTVVLAQTLQNPSKGKGLKDPLVRAQLKTEKMVENLNLDKTQETKVLQLNIESSTELQILNDQIRALKDQKKTIRKNLELELERVLSSEQLAKHQLAQQKRKRQKRRRGAR